MFQDNDINYQEREKMWKLFFGKNKNDSVNWDAVFFCGSAVAGIVLMIIAAILYK